MLYTILYFYFVCHMHVLMSDVVLLLPFLDLFNVYIFVLNCLIMIENKKNTDTDKK